MSPIYHLTTAAEWAQAQQAGDYRISTRGRTLAEEGFIHASTEAQWPVTRERFFADVTEPLVLLVIDPALLTCELKVEHVPAAGESFPHLYGPLNLDAVVRVEHLDP